MPKHEPEVLTRRRPLPKPPAVRYRGYRRDGTAQVYRVDATGQVSLLPPRYDLANHSPTGFEWGYAGSGPAQLALAICADALGDDAVAREVYQLFKAETIARLPRDLEWHLAVSAVRVECRRILTTLHGRPAA